MVNQEIVDEYQQTAEGMAELLSKWNDLCRKAKWAVEKSGDDGSIVYDAEDAMIKMGVALSTALIYAKESREELQNGAAQS